MLRVSCRARIGIGAIAYLVIVLIRGFITPNPWDVSWWLAQICGGVVAAIVGWTVRDCRKVD